MLPTPINPPELLLAGPVALAAPPLVVPCVTVAPVEDEPAPVVPTATDETLLSVADTELPTTPPLLLFSFSAPPDTDAVGVLLVLPITGTAALSLP